MGTHDRSILVEHEKPKLLFRSWRGIDEIKHILDRKIAGHRPAASRELSIFQLSGIDFNIRHQLTNCVVHEAGGIPSAILIPLIVRLSSGLVE